MTALWPLAAIGAAVAGLAYVWTRDIGGIQTKTREAFSSIKTTVMPFVSILRDDLGKTVTSLGQTYNTVMNAMKRDTAGFRAAVGPPMKALGHLIKLGFGAAAYGAFTLVRQGLALLRGDFGAMVSYGEDFNKRMKMLIGGSGIDSMRILKNAVIGGLGAVKSSLAGGLSYVTGWGGRLTSTITNTGNRSMNALTGSVTRGISSVQSSLNGAARYITNWGRNTVSTFTNAGRNAMAALSGAVHSGISTVKRRMDRLARSVMSYLPPGASGPLGRLKRRAKRIPRDIASGILSGLGGVKKAANRVAGAISDRLPLSPAKEGPLQHGPEERGRVIGQDLAKGMGSEESTVAKAAKGVAEAAAGPLESISNPLTLDEIQEKYGEFDGAAAEEAIRSMTVGEIAELARAGATDDWGHGPDMAEDALREGFMHVKRGGNIAQDPYDELGGGDTYEVMKRALETSTPSPQSSSGSSGGGSGDLTITLELKEGAEKFVKAQIEEHEHVQLKKATNGTF